MVDSAPEQVIVGKITAVYGIKGWVKIHSYTEPDTNLLEFLWLHVAAFYLILCRNQRYCVGISYTFASPTSACYNAVPGHSNLPPVL